MTQRHHLTLLHGEVGADVLAFEQRHPEVSRHLVPLVVSAIRQHPAADGHAAQIDDGLAEHRKSWRAQSVRRTREALRLGYSQLVVDPAVRRIPLVTVGVLGGSATLARG